MSATLSPSAAILADWLEAAGRTLLALPAGSHYRRSLMDRYSAVAALMAALPVPGPEVPPPSIARCEAAESALAVFALLSPRDVRLVAARMLVDPSSRRHLFGWRPLGRLLGVDHHTVQRWHREALEGAAAQLTVRKLRWAA